MPCSIWSIVSSSQTHSSPGTGTSNKPGAALLSSLSGCTKKRPLLHAFCFVIHSDSVNYILRVFSSLVCTKKWVSDQSLRVQKAISIRGMAASSLRLASGVSLM